MSYQLIAFVQGDDARHYLDIFENDGVDAAMDALAENDTDDNETRENPFWGESDDVFPDGNGFFL